MIGAGKNLELDRPNRGLWSPQVLNMDVSVDVQEASRDLETRPVPSGHRPIALDLST